MNELNLKDEEKFKKLLSKIFSKDELMEIIMYAITNDYNYLFRKDLVKEMIREKLELMNNQLMDEFLKNIGGETAQIKKKMKMIEDCMQMLNLR